MAIFLYVILWLLFGFFMVIVEAYRCNWCAGENPDMTIATILLGPLSILIIILFYIGKVFDHMACGIVQRIKGRE